MGSSFASASSRDFVERPGVMSSPAVLHSLTRGARRLVVVDLGFLGDTVHLIPPLWDLRLQYPGAEIHVVTTPLGAAVLTLARCVDRVWTVQLGGPKRPALQRLKEQYQLIRSLRQQRFDLAINFTGADRTLILMGLIGARHGMARMPDRWHFWNPLLLQHWVPQPDRRQSVFDQRRAVLAACGIPVEGPPRFDLRISDEARHWATAIPAGALHLSLSASTPLKEWALDRWIELGRRLTAGPRQVRLVVTCGSNDREKSRVREFIEKVGPDQITEVVLPTLDQFAALLGRCRVHIGSDSGPLHLAMALGIPTIALFRNYFGIEEWLPRGPQHQHVAVDCACSGQRQPPCLNRPSADCLAGITPESVLAMLARVS